MRRLLTHAPACCRILFVAQYGAGTILGHRDRLVPCRHPGATVTIKNPRNRGNPNFHDRFVGQLSFQRRAARNVHRNGRSPAFKTAVSAIS